MIFLEFRSFFCLFSGFHNFSLSFGVFPLFCNFSGVSSYLSFPPFHDIKMAFMASDRHTFCGFPQIFGTFLGFVPLFGSFPPFCYNYNHDHLYSSLPNLLSRASGVGCPTNHLCGPVGCLINRSTCSHITIFQFPPNYCGSMVLQFVFTCKNGTSYS